MRIIIIIISDFTSNQPWENWGPDVFLNGGVGVPGKDNKIIIIPHKIQ